MTVRRRLLAGLAVSIQERGLAQTRVEDVVRHARTSKRTFYEQYADLTACFLDLYRVSTDGLIATLEQACTDAAPRGIEQVIRAGVQALLDAVAAEPALVEAHFREVYGLGPAGLDARRDVLDRHAAALVAGLSRTRSHVTLSPTRAVMAVGALNELVLRALEQGRLSALGEELDDAVGFVRGALRG